MLKLNWKIFTASLLVAGTAIGAGMLALPVATAQGGFWPASVIFFLCWIFSASTGLLLLEACMWLPKDTNIISLSTHLLGKKGKIASWFLYLFLFYSLTVAYMAGGGAFVNEVAQNVLTPKMAIFFFVLIFSPIIYIGTHAVDRVNAILMIGIIVSFFGFVAVSSNVVKPQLLTRINWPLSFLALPLIFTSFSYQGIIPSLRNYFHSDSKSVRKAIIFGTFFPLIVYIIWEYLILGIVPLTGSNGLLAAKSRGFTAVMPLKHFVDFPYIYFLGQAFAFFALTTSFLGVTLGLFDFLSDGLKLPKKGFYKILLFIIVYLPPMIIAMLNPNIFISALNYAGGIGCALLLGLIPIFMVWSGRYKKKLGREHLQLKGGKCALILLSCFIVFELIIEIINELT